MTYVANRQKSTALTYDVSLGQLSLYALVIAMLYFNTFQKLRHIRGVNFQISPWQKCVIMSSFKCKCLSQNY